MSSGLFTMSSAARAALCLVVFFTALGSAFATSNREYGPNEYVVINGGLSPNRKYSIAAHGRGELGYENFHIYLMNAATGKKIGPLLEIKDTLDTGANAFHAKWSRNSTQVAIRYRVDRREAHEVRYRIAKSRAYRLSGPSKADGLRFD
jgi:hypothetical protein